MVIVQPDPIDGIVPEGGLKRLHTVASVSRMGRADALPAVRWRADLPIRSDRRCLRALLQVVGKVHRIEFGEHLRALGVQQRHPIRAQAARADPYRVDSIIGQRTSLVEPFGRDSAVDSTYLHCPVLSLTRIHRTADTNRPFCGCKSARSVLY